MVPGAYALTEGRGIEITGSRANHVLDVARGEVHERDRAWSYARTHVVPIALNAEAVQPRHCVVKAQGFRGPDGPAGAAAGARTVEQHVAGIVRVPVE